MIDVQNITKTFGQVTALDDLSLHIPEGAIFGFLGPNGAGKTTLLHIMTELAKPDSGKITIDGVRVGTAYPPIGFLPDMPAFYNWMTAHKFMQYIADLHQLSNPPIDDTLEKVGLTDAISQRIGGYSRGMKQRLGLAQALLARPRVLLLDEPVSALDPAGRKDVLDILESLRGEMTVFFSTHILSDAERVCDEVAIINKGRLIVQSRRDDLLATYAKPIFEIETNAPINILRERVESLSWVQMTEPNGKSLRVTVTDVDAAQRNLPAACDGIPIRRLEMVNTTLEDVFLNMTEVSNDTV